MSTMKTTRRQAIATVGAVAVGVASGVASGIASGKPLPNRATLFRLPGPVPRARWCLASPAVYLEVDYCSDDGGLEDFERMLSVEPGDIVRFRFWDDKSVTTKVLRIHERGRQWEVANGCGHHDVVPSDRVVHSRNCVDCGALVGQSKSSVREGK